MTTVNGFVTCFLRFARYQWFSSSMMATDRKLSNYVFLHASEEMDGVTSRSSRRIFISALPGFSCSQLVKGAICCCMQSIFWCSRPVDLCHVCLNTSMLYLFDTYFWRAIGQPDTWCMANRSCLVLFS